jgi:hypothetical protein
MINFRFFLLITSLIYSFGALATTPATPPSFGPNDVKVTASGKCNVQKLGLTLDYPGSPCSIVYGAIAPNVGAGTGTGVPSQPVNAENASTLNYGAAANE